MSKLFCEHWACDVARVWNSDTQMLTDLESHGFDGVIGFGLQGEQLPRCVLVVVDGKVEHAGLYDGRNVDWDLRASMDDWSLWMREGFGLKRLGFTTATGRLKFVKGDYRRMLRTPTLARSFLRVFDLMAQVPLD